MDVDPTIQPKRKRNDVVGQFQESSEGHQQVPVQATIGAFQALHLDNQPPPMKRVNSQSYCLRCIAGESGHAAHLDHI